jgi:transposase
LEREGRGGRRWAYLSLAGEQALLQDWQEQAVRGEVLTAKQLHAHCEKAAGRKISLGYAYRLLHRHGWRKLGPRPRHPKAQPATRQRFKKNSRVIETILRCLPAGIQLRLLFQNEARFGCISDQRRCWAP